MAGVDLIKPKRIAEHAYLCRRWTVFHTEDGKPDYCTRCRKYLDWRGNEH